jgi:hypothetical protein
LSSARRPCGLVRASSLRNVSRRGASVLLEPISNPAFGEVIWSHLDEAFVTGQYTNTILTHLASRMCDDFVAVVELHPERRVRQKFLNNSWKL